MQSELFKQLIVNSQQLTLPDAAIEIDIDLTSPEFHPYAKDTKDVAAGAVLISAITAFIVGVSIFAKYII